MSKSVVVDMFKQGQDRNRIRYIKTRNILVGGEGGRGPETPFRDRRPGSHLTARTRPEDGCLG